MENEDWVKFAGVLWSSRKGERQRLILERYKQAWTMIYNTDPLLNEDGGPENFLYNLQYTCRKPVPWLAAALEDGPGPAPGPPQREPGPSTSAPGPSDFYRPLSEPSSVDHPPADDSDDAGLDYLLRKSCPKIEAVAPFVTIAGTLFPGFREYLDNPNKPCVRVIFPIIPQYRIKLKNEMSTPYISCMELSPSDAEFISQVDPTCLYRAKEQRLCVEGQVRYFCSSWVSQASFYLFKVISIRLCIACLGFGDARAPEHLEPEAYALG